MIDTKYENSVMLAAYLAGCAVRNQKPDTDKLKGIDLSFLFTASERHLLSAAVAVALRSAGVIDENFIQAEAKAKRKNALLDSDRHELAKHLDDLGIWYMPLKGSVLKDIYPVYGMRQMSDNDILVDPSREADVRRVMEALGFDVVSYGRGNHDIYHKQPVSNIEIHTSLFGPSSGKKIYEYYTNVEEKLIPVTGFEKKFSDEDFYLYMIAHEYKHYANSGTGLRSLLDVYVFLRTHENDMEEDYIESELKKLGLDIFEKENRDLAFHLFDGKQLTEKENEILSYMMMSGTYGTQTNFVKNQINRKGRIGYLFSRVFLPYNLMLYQYPVLDRAPYLLPVFWIVRIVRAVIEKPGKVLFQLKVAFRLKNG